MTASRVGRWGSRVMFLLPGTMPSDARESPEISVEGHSRGCVRDGDGGEVGFVDKIARRPDGRKESPKHINVAGRGLDDRGRWPRDPPLDHTRRLLDGERPTGDSRVRSQPKETEHSAPGESDGLATLQRLDQPRTCDRVPVRVFVDGVQQDVGVDDLQRPALNFRMFSSSSSCAAMWDALSQSNSGRNPIGKDGIRYGSRAGWFR